MRGGETWQVLVFRNWYRCSVHGFSPLPGLDLTTPALRPQSRAGSSITASAFAKRSGERTVKDGMPQLAAVFSTTNQ